jgi:hypothetical protein
MVDWPNEFDKFEGSKLFADVLFGTQKRMMIPDGHCQAGIPGQKIGLPGRFGTACTLLSIALVGFLFVFTGAAGESSTDTQSKSKFLLNFAEFTEWPASAFASENEPLIIGILGRDPFGKPLDKLAENEILKGRHVRVMRYRKVEEIKACHILYISKSEEPRLDRILRALKGKPVLTVSEMENSAIRGVMIRMRTENERIRLEINLESAKAAGLTLKSKLLRLGEIVEPAKK